MENQQVDKIRKDIADLIDIVEKLTNLLEHQSQESNLVMIASDLLGKISEKLPIKNDVISVEESGPGSSSTSVNQDGDVTLAGVTESSHSLIGNNSHIIVILDRQGSILSHNQFNEHFQIAGIVGKSTIFDYFSLEYQSQITDALEAVFHEGRSGDFESYAPSDKLWFMNHIGPLVENGRVVSAMIVSRDITQLKRTERKQEDNEQRFRRYFELSLVGIAITSIQKDWVEVNDRLCEIFGYKREELTKKTWGEITHPDDLANDVSQFERVLSGDIDGYSLDKRFIRGDGRVIHASIDVKCLRDPNGEVDYFVAMVQDITHRIEAEHQLRVQHEQLAHAGRISTMAEMASGLAHEINQPLSAIELSSFAAVKLLESPEFSNSQLCSILTSIENQATRAGNVVQRLRSFIRKEDSIRTRVNLFELICEVIAFVEHDLRVSQTQIETRLDEAVPLTNADPIQLQQVLVNLVRNAIDAMSDTPIDERILIFSLSSLSAEGVEVAVSDYGVGVNSLDQKNLFQAFFTTKKQGLGMGLAISRSIIEDHGGQLTAECNDEQGMTFRFTLPIAGVGIGTAE